MVLITEDAFWAITQRRSTSSGHRLGWAAGLEASAQVAKSGDTITGDKAGKNKRDGATRPAALKIYC